MAAYTFALTEDEQTQVNAALQTLQTVLQPKLIDLSTEQRQELLKMGDKTLAFVEKALVYMEQNANLVPSYVNLSEAQADLAAVRSIRIFHNKVSKLNGMMIDSMSQSGSEAYGSALMFYQSLKVAARAGVPGAEDIQNDLRTRFPGRPKGN